MKELYELREMLEKELKEHGSKGELSTGSLDIIDKLSHAIKNLDKIIECDENGGYSGHYPYYMGYGYDDGIGRNGSYNDGSYARGRGSNAKRDSMGRYSSNGGYSRHGEVSEEIKKDIQRLADKVEQM